MTNKKKVGNGIPWGLIIFFFIFCLPVGVILGYKKLISNRVDVEKNCAMANALLMIMLAASTIFALESDLNGAAITIFIVIPLSLWVAGILIIRDLRVNSRRYKKYLNLIEQKNIFSLDKISQDTGIPFYIIVTDLINLQEIGYLKDTIIDVGKREIISKEILAQKRALKPITVACQNCGANNAVIRGSIAKCEYCDSLLKF